ncbi:MAG TPA: DUF6036 family nucleotidyltransferase [Gemmataceae bacterium]|jgi:hypothetical protein
MKLRKSRRFVADPWALVWGQPYIDSVTLAAALEDDLQHNPRPDYRTRLLIRDAARAIRSFWGAKKFRRWLATSPTGERIRAILNESFPETGFPHIRRRLVDSIGATQVKQVFTLLGQQIHQRIEVYVAGSIPTLIEGLTARPTEDIDLVDEVPAEIRKQRAVLRKIASDYGLRLGHVQSHYLPANWANRRQFLGDFGGLRVYLVDPYDIFVSKLSSKQKKHRDDLRVLALKLDPETARQRLLGDGRAFLEDPRQRPQIEANWQFIYQEALAAESTGESAERPASRSSKKGKKRGRKKGAE